MAVFFDSRTGFPVGDPDAIPLAGALPSRGELDAAFSPLILSASGWRKVFAVSGDEEDRKPAIGCANAVLAAHMADVFADYLIARDAAGPRRVVLGLDSRPTGTEIGDIMCRVFISRGFDVRYLFISAAPEIMAYARDIGAFAYVSASHNPIAHNGVKFGLGDGGVLPGQETAKLIASFRTAIARDDAAQKARELMAACSRDALHAVWTAISAEKARALSSYAAFSREVISGEQDAVRQTEFFGRLSAASAALALEGRPVSIIADFNGSARGCSIDRTFIEATGIALFGMNESPREIAHRIVPEGDSLAFCAREIERLRREGRTAEERNALLGYVPDCDGDRGNIVFWSEKSGRAETLEAQEVFALAVIAELSHLAWLGKISCERGKPSSPPAAIAINDPTSLRIEEIASAFGVTVARAEVGEANVVNLARELRAKGSIVRILGEGSNGGNITHPAAVRDPLNTVYAILKLLVIRDAPATPGKTAAKPGLFHLWCSLSGQEDTYRDGFTLEDVLASLPGWVTTSVYEKDAMLRITTADHVVLKRNFQRVYLREWEARKEELLSRFGFAQWIAIRNNGTEQEIGIADFGASGKGGLKVQFLDRDGTPAGYIWMRGSGTEPVFRILADARGSDPAAERYLLSWLTGMVLEADRKI